MNSSTIRNTILEMAGKRGPETSICPSEVARSLESESWRELMPVVREVAAELADEGEVRITQFGKAVDARNPRGHIRISIVDPS